MITTSEGLADNSQIPLRKSVPVNNTSAKKLLRKFSELLDFKQKTSVRRLCASKSNHKDIIIAQMLWSSIPKRRG